MIFNIFFKDEPFLEKTLPVNSERLIAAQVIHEKKNLNYFDLVNNFNLGFKIFLSLGLVILVFSIICLLLSRFTIRSLDYKRGNVYFKLVFLIKHFLRIKNILSVKLVLLFFTIFLWHCDLFFSNNIKTSKILVIDPNISIFLDWSLKIICKLFF